MVHKTSLRVIVCGGRDYTDRDAVVATLDTLLHTRGPFVLISGAARGADSLAAAWAKANKPNGIDLVEYLADWENDGKAAGPIRNSLMLVHGRPNGVVAFPGGVGTADMIRKAKAADVPVWQPFGPKK